MWTYSVFFFHDVTRYSIYGNERSIDLIQIHIIFVFVHPISSLFFFIFLVFGLSFCLIIISVRCSVTRYSPFLYLWSVIFNLCLVTRVILNVCAQVYKTSLLVIIICSIGIKGLFDGRAMKAFTTPHNHKI